jgi:RNA polymerase sigma-70 factor (ECF subfamily)
VSRYQLAPAAWEELFRNHHAHVHRLALALTRDPYAADDLTQEVFLRIQRSFDTYRPGNFDAWLYRVTVNLFRDDLRRHTRVRLEPLRDDTVDRNAQRSLDPEVAVLWDMYDEDVEQALAALPAVIRTVVKMYEVDGMTYAEISATLGIRRGTVASRLHRGRTQLRQALNLRMPPDRPPDQGPKDDPTRAAA